MACSSCNGGGPCGCCEGTAALTPADRTNRAGLPALAYRAGTHGQFLATMKARLSSIEVDAPASDGSPAEGAAKLRPLKALATRDSGDFSIALLDGWASIGDLLCFYQERIANEGYLRTATERRSVIELARLVGYELRPGVAASVHLAYTIDSNQPDAVPIPAGTRAQSLPGPGESPQSFETAENLIARREWNDLRPRLRRPQTITLETVLRIDRVHVVGRSVNLRTGDPLLFVFDHPIQRGAMRTVLSTEDGDEADTSLVRLAPVPEALAVAVPVLLAFANSGAAGAWRTGKEAGDRRAVERGDDLLRAALMDGRGAPGKWVPEMQMIADGELSPELREACGRLQDDLGERLREVGSAPIAQTGDPARLIERLLIERHPQVRTSAGLRRSLAGTFGRHTDAAPQLLISFAPRLRDGFYQGWGNANVATEPAQLIGLHALRVSAAPFGAAAAREPTVNTTTGAFAPAGQWPEWTVAPDEKDEVVWLDQIYAPVVSGGYAVVQQLGSGDDEDDGGRRLFQILAADGLQRTAYGFSGKTTRLTLDGAWWSPHQGARIGPLRSTLVHTAGEPLELAEEPIVEDVGGQEVELGALYEELASGRFVILSGERTDIPGVAGVHASELMMLTNVVHGYDKHLPGDKTHTTLSFATGTAYRYRRDTLVIHGNVVRATHGETRSELLGSGDGTAALQSFTLKQPPLTYTAAPTAAGTETTLEVYVDEVAWHEADSLARLGPKDRAYVTATDDADNTRLTFGDGVNGARLPSGVQNVRARYRSGIGAGGNVKAGQVSLLQSRPLGVSAVLNPLRASGGADRESRDLARENAPLAVATLDRIVSVADYAAFARRFAGVAKATAAVTTDGRRRLLHMTIAGVDDAPIDRASDLYRNLLAALRRLGDESLPLAVELRELKALVLSANIRLAPGHLWDPVAAAVRATLLDRFGFHRRALGQPARLAQIVAAIHSLPGVDYVDVDAFGAIPEKVGKGSERRLIRPGEIADLVTAPASAIKSAQLALTKPPPGGGGCGVADVMAWPGGFDAGALRPAELAIFTPDVPDTLILNEVP